MNLPNKLTVLRMALVPVFIVCFYLGQPGAAEGALLVASLPAKIAFAVLAFVVFGVASLTDMLDGQIARKRGLITNFGKLMDPLADKVLTTAAFVCFVDTSVMAAWMLIVILAREFAITSLRAIAASEGVVLAAGSLGKLKTVLQMAAILLLLLMRVVIAADTSGAVPWGLNWFAQLVLLAAVIITVWSGIDYLWKGRKLLNIK